MADFVIDLNADKAGDVDLSRRLDVNILAGTQQFPQQDNPNDVANRLLVFTGTAIFSVGRSDDLTRGVVRVRLGYKVSAARKYVGSASMAALASIHGEDDENSVFAADSAEVVVGPTGGRPLPDNGLPKDELYLLVNIAVLGGDAVLARVAYQANILIADTYPEIESLYVRRADHGDMFQPNADVSPGNQWEYLVTLTGPVPGTPADVFSFSLSSSNTNLASIDLLHVLGELHGGQTSGGARISNPIGSDISMGNIATITVQGKTNAKTATLTIPFTR